MEGVIVSIGAKGEKYGDICTIKQRTAMPEDHVSSLQRRKKTWCTCCQVLADFRVCADRDVVGKVCLLASVR